MMPEPFYREKESDPPSSHSSVAMTTIGILSDTHLSSPSPEFLEDCKKAFRECSAIIHAGDLTDVSILSVFHGKTVHGVQGNMCNGRVREYLPEQKLIEIEGYQIGITHGAGSRYNIEERVYALFPEADCIVFGHSHMPLIERVGTTLLVNPGSFRGTGPYGAPGTYALLKAGEKRLEAKIHSLAEHRERAR
jgi:putative phosphoesterase